MTESDSEVDTKLQVIRHCMAKAKLSAVRLKGVDWFSWATAGGSSVVILTNETGVGEVLVTQEDAIVLTNTIEQQRFQEEELSSEYKVWAAPWSDSTQPDQWIQDLAKGGPIGSDRPEKGERKLPTDLVRAKQKLLPEEIRRYRQLGQEAAEAMTEALLQAQPDWTELQLAGAGAQALWNRGIHPTLTLVAGQTRLMKYRHPCPTTEKLGLSAMLVFCARRHGLYANLSRFVFFKEPSSAKRAAFRALAEVEAGVLDCSRAGIPLGKAYQALVAGYEAIGFPDEELRHHQGGTTGYLSREVFALPGSLTRIENSTALAWNPSLPGLKIEDTALATEDRVEFLTTDPNWPVLEIKGRLRPNLWVRT